MDAEESSGPARKSQRDEPFIAIGRGEKAASIEQHIAPLARLEATGRARAIVEGFALCFVSAAYPESDWHQHTCGVHPPPAHAYMPWMTRCFLQQGRLQTDEVTRQATGRPVSTAFCFSSDMALFAFGFSFRHARWRRAPDVDVVVAAAAGRVSPLALPLYRAPPPMRVCLEPTRDRPPISLLPTARMR